MVLGGFVIHASNRSSIVPCADALAAVADVCVAVDTGSTDGTDALLRGRGFEVLRRPWEGYGAARAAAVEALRGCDYVFFLDSDEWLAPPAAAALRAWKRSSPRAPHYQVARRDWADVHGRRFLYRTEHHVRLVRREAARWDRSMIVHEALDAPAPVTLPVTVEHAFADDVDAMRAKVDRYALLWALRYCRERRRAKPEGPQLVFHLLREALLKGSLLRGGLPALRLAEVVARHHSRKYALLREVRAGAHPELVRAYDEGRLDDLYRLLPEGRAAARGPVAAAAARRGAHEAAEPRRACTRPAGT